MRQKERSDRPLLVSIADIDEDTPILFKSTLRHGSALSKSAVVRSEAAFEPQPQVARAELPTMNSDRSRFRDKKTPLEIPAPSAPSASTELEPGALLFDQYVVDRVVGSMGSAVVIKLRHARLGQRYYLKHLSEEAARKPGAVPQFYSGARAAMRLQSEHAARTLDVGRLPSGLPYVITEAFPGSELREVLRMRGALALTEAADFVLQAAHAVAEAHHYGLAHGTLSPSTLFVTRREDGLALIKVFEFGIAETLRRDPLAIKLQNWSQGTAVYWESLRLWDTLAYSAPEQIRATKETTHWSDVWALGAILHELLSGSPPFSGPNSVSLLAAIVADAPEPLGALRPGIPRAVERLVLRCLAKEQSERFASIADFAIALRPFASVEGELNVDRIVRIQQLDLQETPLSRPAPASSRRRSSSRPKGLFPRIALLFVIGLGLGAVASAGAFVARHYVTAAHSGDLPFMKD